MGNLRFMLRFVSLLPQLKFETRRPLILTSACYEIGSSIKCQVHFFFACFGLHSFESNLRAFVGVYKQEKWM